MLTILKGEHGCGEIRCDYDRRHHMTKGSQFGLQYFNRREVSAAVRLRVGR